MKINQSTLKILNNFCSINNGIIVRKGSVLRTISESKIILAEATVPEYFETDFSFYNLRKFLAAISLFNDPDINFSEKSVVISSGNHSIEFYYSSPNLLIEAPSNRNFPSDADVQFQLTEENIKHILRTSSLLDCDVLCLSSDSGLENVTLTVNQESHATSDSSTLTIEGKYSEPFQFNFDIENLKIMPDDYTVNIFNKGLIQFKSETLNLDYYVGLKVKK